MTKATDSAPDTTGVDEELDLERRLATLKVARLQKVKDFFNSDLNRQWVKAATETMTAIVAVKQGSDANVKGQMQNMIQQAVGTEQLVDNSITEQNNLTTVGLDATKA